MKQILNRLQATDYNFGFNFVKAADHLRSELLKEIKLLRNTGTLHKVPTSQDVLESATKTVLMAYALNVMHLDPSDDSTNVMMPGKVGIENLLKRVSKDLLAKTEVLTDVADLDFKTSLEKRIEEFDAYSFLLDNIDSAKNTGLLLLRIPLAETQALIQAIMNKEPREFENLNFQEIFQNIVFDEIISQIINDMESENCWHVNKKNWTAKAKINEYKTMIMNCVLSNKASEFIQRALEMTTINEVMKRESDPNKIQDLILANNSNMAEKFLSLFNCVEKISFDLIKLNESTNANEIMTKILSLSSSQLVESKVIKEDALSLLLHGAVDFYSYASVVIPNKHIRPLKLNPNLTQEFIDEFNRSQEALSNLFHDEDSALEVWPELQVRCLELFRNLGFQRTDYDGLIGSHQFTFFKTVQDVMLRMSRFDIKYEELDSSLKTLINFNLLSNDAEVNDASRIVKEAAEKNVSNIYLVKTPVNHENKAEMKEKKNMGDSATNVQEEENEDNSNISDYNGTRSEMSLSNDELLFKSMSISDSNKNLNDVINEYLDRTSWIITPESMTNEDTLEESTFTECYREIEQQFKDFEEKQRLGLLDDEDVCTMIMASSGSKKRERKDGIAHFKINKKWKSNSLKFFPGYAGATEDKIEEDIEMYNDRQEIISNAVEKWLPERKAIPSISFWTNPVKKIEFSEYTKPSTTTKYKFISLQPERFPKCKRDGSHVLQRQKQIFDICFGHFSEKPDCLIAAVEYLMENKQEGYNRFERIAKAKGMKVHNSSWMLFRTLCSVEQFLFGDISNEPEANMFIKMKEAKLNNIFNFNAVQSFVTRKGYSFTSSDVGLLSFLIAFFHLNRVSRFFAIELDMKMDLFYQIFHDKIVLTRNEIVKRLNAEYQRQFAYKYLYEFAESDFTRISLREFDEAEMCQTSTIKTALEKELGIYESEFMALNGNVVNNKLITKHEQTIINSLIYYKLIYGHVKDDKVIAELISHPLIERLSKNYSWSGDIINGTQLFAWGVIVNKPITIIKERLDNIYDRFQAIQDVEHANIEDFANQFDVMLSQNMYQNFLGCMILPRFAIVNPSASCVVSEHANGVLINPRNDLTIDSSINQIFNETKIFRDPIALSNEWNMRTRNLKFFSGVYVPKILNNDLFFLYLLSLNKGIQYVGITDEFLNNFREIITSYIGFFLTIGDEKADKNLERKMDKEEEILQNKEVAEDYYQILERGRNLIYSSFNRLNLPVVYKVDFSNRMIVSTESEGYLTHRFEEFGTEFRKGFVEEPIIGLIGSLTEWGPVKESGNSPTMKLLNRIREAKKPINLRRDLGDLAMKKNYVKLPVSHRAGLQPNLYTKDLMKFNIYLKNNSKTQMYFNCSIKRGDDRYSPYVSFFKDYSIDFAEEYTRSVFNLLVKEVDDVTKKNTQIQAFYVKDNINSNREFTQFMLETVANVYLSNSLFRSIFSSAMEQVKSILRLQGINVTNYFEEDMIIFMQNKLGMDLAIRMNEKFQFIPPFIMRNLLNSLANENMDLLIKRNYFIVLQSEIKFEIA